MARQHLLGECSSIRSDAILAERPFLSKGTVELTLPTSRSASPMPCSTFTERAPAMPFHDRGVLSFNVGMTYAGSARPVKCPSPAPSCNFAFFDVDFSHIPPQLRPSSSLTFIRRLSHRHRTSSTINRVHQYTSPLALPPGCHPTQFTSYAFGVAASMDLSVLVSTTRLLFSRAAAHIRHALPMTTPTISIPGPPLLPLSPRAICVIAARANWPLAIAHMSPQTGPLAISSPV
jgi:hypothetical protein